jgi:hypothetical protein
VLKIGALTRHSDLYKGSGASSVLDNKEREKLLFRHMKASVALKSRRMLAELDAIRATYMKNWQIASFNMR